VGKVYIKDGVVYIKFNDDLAPYPIDVDRCDTYPKIVNLIAHLSEKKWCTSGIIGDFIDTVCGRHGLNYHNDGAS